MTWYIDEGPSGDVVLSSRVRLARNVAAYPFSTKLAADQQKELAEKVSEAFFSANSGMHEQYEELVLSDMSAICCNALAEHRLISNDLVEQLKHTDYSPRVILNKDESVCIMVGEEDHLRIQAMSAGFALEEAYQRAEEVAKLFEEKMRVAWDPRFGFLTACPTNTGTGMRASVMVHLIGLSKLEQIPALQKRLSTLGFALRGNAGEKSSAEGHLYQISNQVTLGMSEHDLLHDLTGIVQQIIDLERQARETIHNKFGLEIEDQIYRSLGVLQQARKISGKEAMHCLSHVAMGGELGLFDKPVGKSVKKAMALVGAASIQEQAGCELGTQERDIERAKVLREIFADYER